MTDEALMLAVRDGHISSLGPLFERYHRPLFDFLSRMTGNRAAAEDLVQDVFIRVLRYRGTYREDGRFETWLYRIARNARADYFQARSARETHLDAAGDPASSVQGADDLLERDRETARLARALKMLREDQRELIILARYRGMKYEAIAEVLDVEVGTVKVRMHRAVTELRRIFLHLSENQSCTATLPASVLPSV